MYTGTCMWARRFKFEARAGTFKFVLAHADTGTGSEVHGEGELEWGVELGGGVGWERRSWATYM